MGIDGIEMGNWKRSRGIDREAVWGHKASAAIPTISGAAIKA